MVIFGLHSDRLRCGALPSTFVVSCDRSDVSGTLLGSVAFQLGLGRAKQLLLDGAIEAVRHLKTWETELIDDVFVIDLYDIGQSKRHTWENEVTHYRWD